jgi:hypothetical protein
MENQINAVNNAVNYAVENEVDNTKAAEAVLSYVNQFSIHTKNTASSYLEMCKVVFDANEVLSQKDFQLFCVTAHIGIAKASKLKLIGKRYETLKQYVDTLPVNWTTLYKLTHLEDERIGELVEEGKLYPEMPTKDLIDAAPELLETKGEKAKADGKTIQSQSTLQKSKELNAMVVLEDGFNDGDITKVRTILEQLKSIGARVEMSIALVERIEELNVVVMESSTVIDKADVEVEEVDPYEEDSNEPLAA